MSLLITWRIRHVPASGRKGQPGCGGPEWIWAGDTDREGVDPQRGKADGSAAYRAEAVGSVLGRLIVQHAVSATTCSIPN